MPLPPPDVCDWSGCAGCAATRRFVAKWNAGQLRPHPPTTSTWWESAEAERLYRRGVNRPRREPTHADP